MTSRIEQWLKWIHKYSLLLIAFFLPVHTRFTGVFVLTALATWLLVNHFRFSFPDKKKFRVFLSFTLLYFCYGIGMIYSSNQAVGWQQMQLRSTMVLFPLMFLSQSKIEMPPLREVLQWIVAGCIFISLILLAHGGYIYFSEHRNIFFYGYLTEFLGIHPTYISMYLVFIVIAIALEMLRQLLSRNEKIIYAVLEVFFLLMVIILSAREEIITMITAFIVLLIMHFSIRTKIMTGIVAGAFLSLLFITLFLFFPLTQQRFLNIRQEWDVASNDHPNSINMRKVVWQTSTEFISRHAIVGVGTGDVEDSLLKCYERKNLQWPFNDRQNAHDQFLQTTLALGAFGLLALILLFITGFKLAIISRSELYFLFLLIFISSSLTESMFETEAGVLFFSFFNSVLAAECLNRKEQELVAN